MENVGDNQGPLNSTHVELNVLPESGIAMGVGVNCPGYPGLGVPGVSD